MEETEYQSQRELSIVQDDLESHQLPRADSDLDAKPNTAGISSTFHQSKWQRLRKYYNDDYLRLFNQTHEHDVEAQTPSNFGTSQIGAVIWTSNEKELFFSALSRFGRHNLASLAAEITTKSEIEIKGYIDTLQDAHADRQRFSRKTKEVSYPQIPAAIDIGKHCEHALERAADALSAFQEQYDLTTAQQKVEGPGLIDYTFALHLDAQGDAAEARSDDLDDEEIRVSPNALFFLSNWLELSESVFMNSSAVSGRQDWTQLADSGQRPSLTVEVIKIFHDIVVSLTQRIVQVSIFMAKSRLRSMTRDHYTPARSLAKSDVLSALDVLGVTQNSWDYWINVARRNELQVISGSHSKGQSVSEEVSYDLAEAFLSSSKPRKRSRSVSSGSDISLGSDFTSANKAAEAFNSEAEIGSDLETSEEHTDTSEIATEDELDSVSVHDQSPAQRLRMFEQAQDEQAEQLDQQAQEQEERILWQALKGEDSSDPQMERDRSTRMASKTMRKTNEELQMWSCKYRTEWESYGRISPDEFREPRPRKRIKLYDDNVQD